MKTFLQEVSLGLSTKNKKLSSKWFYDFYGSKLFEQITRLEEYYPTRTERKILKDNKTELATEIGKSAVLIEPGAGDIKKIAIFLSILDKPKKYIPLDISEDYITKLSQGFKKKFPKLAITPKGYDFSKNNKLPFKIKSSENIIIFFPTIVFIKSVMYCSVNLSNELVASSKIRICGSKYSALAIANLCLWPPDRFNPRSFMIKFLFNLIFS